MKVNKKKYNQKLSENQYCEEINKRKPNATHSKTKQKNKHLFSAKLLKTFTL